MCRIRPILIVLVLTASSLVVAGDVTVSLEDGRVLTGQVDSRSDEQTLWLRRSEGNVILITAIAWDKVDSAIMGQDAVESEELPTVLRAQATDEPAAFLTEFELGPGTTPHSTPAMAQSPRIVRIQVDAVLANLDRTVEADGLLVAVSAIDEWGGSVPVRGSLSARLWVERIDLHSGQVTFEEFQRWSSPIVPADFYQGVAELPLRFRRQSPEFDWQFCTAALLNLRLSVYGEGNYEASVPVAIHEFNPIRDELRNQQGLRFFPNELTHQTRQDGPRNLHRGYSSPKLRTH